MEGFGGDLEEDSSGGSGGVIRMEVCGGGSGGVITVDTPYTP